MAIKLAPDAFDYPEGAAPATPDTGYVRLYAKADGNLYQKDDAGVETALGGGGTGDVVGPGSSTDLAIARFDGTTGKLIQNSNALLYDNGAIDITLTADVGLLITQNATQTIDPLVIQDSSGNDQVRIRPDGGGTFNEEGNDVDFRVETNNNANTFFVDGGNDNVGIGTATPSANSIIDITSTTKFALMPRMTTAQKNALTPVEGAFVFDIDLDRHEEYTGSAWQAAGGSGIGGSTGTDDNRLLRADGTGGATVQASAVTLDDSGGFQEVNQLNFLDATELTLDTSGEVTITGSYHRLDTFSNAASDTLVTINGGEEGDILYVRIESAARVIIIQNYNGISGNIYTHHGQDVMFSSPHQIGLLLCVGASWKLLGTLSYYDMDSLASETSPANDDLFFLGDTSGVTLKKITFEDLAAAIIHPFAILADEKAANTAGGAAAATTWNARNLNTEIVDANAIVSISSNQFTPIAGTYRIFVQSPAFKTGNHRLRLYNVTGAASVKEGQNARAGSGNDTETNATLDYEFTANGTDAYRIDHYTTVAAATNGLGVQLNVGGAVETYMVIYLEKIG